MAATDFPLRLYRPEPDFSWSAGRALREMPCDLCTEVDFELVADRDRQGGNLPTVVCRTCGLVSHLAIPSDEELVRYYRRRYRREYHGQLSPAPHRVVRAWRRGTELTQLLAPWLQAEDNVLEVGAGLGCTVKQFELAGFNAAGIEPGLAFQDFCQGQLRAQVERGIWQEQTPWPRYQLVLLVHVIEHLSSPRAALTHLRRLLVPGGRLYVECPNLYASPAAPGRLFHPAHVYNFTPDTLAMLCRGCGFEIEALLNGSRDRNLRFLLRRAEASTEIRIPESYARTREALSRYNLLTYHLRWPYLRERLRGLIRDLSDHWQAAQRVEAIISLCAQSSSTDKSLAPSFSQRRAA